MKAGRTVTASSDSSQYPAMLYAMNMGTGSRILSSGSGGSSLGGGGSLALSSLYGGNITGSGPLASSAWMDNLSIRQEGDNIVMDKESFSSLVQMMRIQMMMNADREVGVLV